MAAHCVLIPGCAMCTVCNAAMYVEITPHIPCVSRQVQAVTPASGE